MENNSALDLDSIDWEKENNCALVPKFALRKPDLCILSAAVLAAGCYFFAHFPYISTSRHHLPGIGLTVSHLFVVCMFLLAARQKGLLRIRHNCGGTFLLAASVCIGACYAIFANDALRLMNLPVLVCTTAFAMFSLTGAAPFPALTSQALSLGLKKLIPSCFRHFLLPYKAARYATAGKNRQFFRHIFTGLAIGLPIVLLALCLLSSADAVFDSFVFKGLRSIGDPDFGFILRILLTLLAASCLFSFMYASMADIPFASAQKKRFKASHVTLMTILVMLGAIYALFVYIQFTYLFFGARTAIQSIGYADCARNGFFQLVALSVLTLCLIIPFLSLCDGNKAVRALCAVISIFTCVIDYSAFFRMRLYIAAYGMSVLRLITLWGMLMILCALVVCMIKCCAPKIRICPCLTVLALLTWIALNFSNVDKQVTVYQVSAFNKGSVSRLDTDYLSGLSPDVLPVLARIEDPLVRDKAVDAVTSHWSDRYPVWYDWSLSWVKYKDRYADSPDHAGEDAHSSIMKR